MELYEIPMNVDFGLAPATPVIGNTFLCNRVPLWKPLLFAALIILIFILGYFFNRSRQEGSKT